MNSYFDTEEEFQRLVKAICEKGPDCDEATELVAFNNKHPAYQWRTDNPFSTCLFDNPIATYGPPIKFSKEL